MSETSRRYFVDIVGKPMEAARKSLESRLHGHLRGGIRNCLVLDNRLYYITGQVQSIMSTASRKLGRGKA